MSRVSIDPVTRLEGHGRIEIFLDAEGNVSDAYFQVPELRGFEQFCLGRRAEEMPVITNRICGVCPEAHHMAASKALDALFAVEPPPAAKKLRELLYMAFYVTDHATHFYALGGPDFIIGPDAPASERNILGVIRKVGMETAQKVIGCRARNHHVIKMLGGRGIHPSAGVPGGWSKSISDDERAEIQRYAEENIEFAQFTLQVFTDVVLRNSAYMEMIQSDVYHHRTHSMGTVDDQGALNFYDGRILVVDPNGAEVARFAPADYAAHIAERVEAWTYLKFPFLKNVGWKGFVDGCESGVYAATPLTRLNVASHLATPRAQAEFERFYEAMGKKRVGSRFEPVHHRLATHWARLVELLYAAERMLELATDPEITSPHVRRIPERIAGVGVGSVEAPRGTLFHHYEADSRGLLTKVNLIVGTTNNYAAIAMSVRKAAQELIRAGTVIEQGLLNRIEMAMRLYDPCFSCATHTLPGAMPLVVNLRTREGALLRTLRRSG